LFEDKIWKRSLLVATSIKSFSIWGTDYHYSSHIHWDSSVFKPKVFIFSLIYSVEFLGSDNHGLFLAYYISSGIILCRQFNTSIHVGHVEGNAFTPVYQSHFSSWRLRSSTSPSIEHLHNQWRSLYVCLSIHIIL
jgi:hypothetical protein